MVKGKIKCHCCPCLCPLSTFPNSCRMLARRFASVTLRPSLLHFHKSCHPEEFLCLYPPVEETSGGGQFSTEYPTSQESFCVSAEGRNFTAYEVDKIGDRKDEDEGERQGDRPEEANATTLLPGYHRHAHMLYLRLDLHERRTR